MDSSGNIYVLGNATGNFGSQINQGTQDVYLTKYDSAGNVVWQQSGGQRRQRLGLWPGAGSGGRRGHHAAPPPPISPPPLSPTATMTVLSRSYDANGNQTWIKQIQTLATNQANAVSVDASGNIYIGGSVSGGVIGAGQTAQGGGDAYLAKLDSNGNLLAENQFGTCGADQVSATATGSDGSLYVASVQNGEAVVAKYASGDITAAPVWTPGSGRAVQAAAPSAA